MHALFLRSGVALVVAAWLSSSALAASNAYLVSGYDETWNGTKTFKAVLGSAQDQYLGKGYTVVRQNSPTQATVLAGLAAADTPVFVFAGHGIKNPGQPFRAEIKVGDGQYVSAQDVIANVPLARRQQFTQVVFQSCGQLHDDWNVAFPNALVWGYSTAATFGQIRWDQWWRGNARITAKADRGAGGLEELLVIDPRISAAVPLTFDASVGGETNEGFANFARYPWAMVEPLAADFGAQRFNMVVGDSPGMMLAIGGVIAEDGKATGARSHAFSSPDFVLGFTNAGFETAAGNIDTLPDLFDNGQAWIADNLTGLPDDTLFFGAAAITFGYNAVPTPGGAVLAGAALALIGARRRR